jgi:DNA-binding MarR family transcriptional regulator
VTQPNGSAADDGWHTVTDVGSSAGRRLTPIETDILLYADEHPDLPVSKIAKAFGTTKARVVKVLGRDR